MYHQDIHVEANTALFQSVTRTGWRHFRGELRILVVKQSQVLHASPVSLASTRILNRGVLKELPFSHGLLHISLSVASALSLLLPACFDSAIVLFSSRVASCCKNGPRLDSYFGLICFSKDITNAHQLTGTRLELYQLTVV